MKLGVRDARKLLAVIDDMSIDEVKEFCHQYETYIDNSFFKEISCRDLEGDLDYIINCLEVIVVENQLDRKTVYIEFDNGDSWGYPSYTISGQKNTGEEIYRKALKTQIEHTIETYEQRKQHNKQNKIDKEKHERELYKQLKAKYES